MRRLWVLMGVLVLAVAACGGGGDADSATTVASGSGDASGGDDTGTDSGAAAGGSAEATLLVGDTTYTWSAEDATNCEIDGIFPASADFGVPPSQGGTGPWFQFIDRGDGGINFSAMFDGEEYNGTGSGGADEITSDGFTYTGSMTHSGEPVDVVLEVTC